MGIQDHLRPLIQGLPEHQQQAIMHRLLSKGVVFGQNPDNLIGLKNADHSAVHRRMEDVGIDSNLENEKLRILNNIANLPYKDRLIAADVFADHIYPGIIEEMQKLGHKVPTQQENMEKYNRSIEDEKAIETKKFLIDEMKSQFGSEPTLANIRAARDYSLPVTVGESPDKLTSTEKAKAYKAGYLEGVQGVMASEEGAGDNRPKSMVFNNKGDVVISGPARVNGNGKKPH